MQRAWRSCEIALQHAGESRVKIIRSWKLNERHYGLLQGHFKHCQYLTDLFGEEQLVRWRRSYTDTPPSLNDPILIKMVNQRTLKGSVRVDGQLSEGEDVCVLNNNPTRRMHEDTLKHLELPFIEHCPSAESLKSCEVRAYGYWKEVQLFFLPACFIKHLAM